MKLTRTQYPLLQIVRAKRKAMHITLLTVGPLGNCNAWEKFYLRLGINRNVMARGSYCNGQIMLVPCNETQCNKKS